MSRLELDQWDRLYFVNEIAVIETYPKIEMKLQDGGKKLTEGSPIEKVSDYPETSMEGGKLTKGSPIKNTRHRSP